MCQFHCPNFNNKMRAILLYKFTVLVYDCLYTYCFTWLYKIILIPTCILLSNLKLFLTYVSTYKCSLHLPFLGIMNFLLCLYNLACLVLVLLLEIWVVSSFLLIQITPEWTSWTNYCFLLCYFLGVYSWDWNYWVKEQEKFYSSYFKLSNSFQKYWSHL